MRVARFLVSEEASLCCVVTSSADPLSAQIADATATAPRHLSDEHLRGADGRHHLEAVKPDLVLMAWWPHILHEDLLAVPEQGTLNFHPSLLPHGRGKHPNFWAIVEETPFGVSIHHAEREVDAGPIAFQRELPVDWTDTGGSLYRRAIEAIVDLFIQSWPSIRVGDIPRVPQPDGDYPTHRAVELDRASRLDLDETMPMRRVLNLLRARTFDGHPGTSFSVQEQEYEVRILVDRRRSS